MFRVINNPPIRSSMIFINKTAIFRCWHEATDDPAPQRRRHRQNKNTDTRIEHDVSVKEKEKEK